MQSVPLIGQGISAGWNTGRPQPPDQLPAVPLAMGINGPQGPSLMAFYGLSVLEEMASRMLATMARNAVVDDKVHDAGLARRSVDLAVELLKITRPEFGQYLAQQKEQAILNGTAHQ